MNHFKLTSEHIVNVFGIKLFRVELVVDCKWGKKGDKGGFLEKEQNVSGNAWVSGNAQVYGNAQVSGNAWVSGNALVYGNAQVSGNAWVSGNALVYGNAQVSGNARVYGNAQVSGDAWEVSPLQIQGTKHFITSCSKTELSIGCHKFTLEYWKKNFKEIGKNNGYTEPEIEEYGLYITLAIKIFKK